MFRPYLLNTNYYHQIDLSEYQSVFVIIKQICFKLYVKINAFYYVYIHSYAWHIFSLFLPYTSALAQLLWQMRKIILFVLFFCQYWILITPIRIFTLKTKTIRIQYSVFKNHIRILITITIIQQGRIQKV